MALVVLLVAGDEVADPVTETVGTTEGPMGASLMASLARTQPDFAVSAAGHSTWVNETVGLFASSNQSKRQ